MFTFPGQAILGLLTGHFSCFAVSLNVNIYVNSNPILRNKSCDAYSDLKFCASFRQYIVLYRLINDLVLLS